MGIDYFNIVYSLQDRFDLPSSFEKKVLEASTAGDLYQLVCEHLQQDIEIENLDMDQLWEDVKDVIASALPDVQPDEITKDARLVEDLGCD